MNLSLSPIGVLLSSLSLDIMRRNTYCQYCGWLCILGLKVSSDERQKKIR